MMNTLPFWTLQHLYVILSLADARDIEDILAINAAFEILHPEVERMEWVQAELGERVKPLVQHKNELAQLRKAAENEPSTKEPAIEVIIQSQEKNDATLKELDKELQEIQATTPEFEWTPEAIETIRNVVPHVFKALGWQHEQLNGYRRIKATAEIIRFFNIPVSVSL